MFFHPKNLKSENNNPWFKPWFNILMHTQSIVCATVDRQCLEYLGYITLPRVGTQVNNQLLVLICTVCGSKIQHFLCQLCHGISNLMIPKKQGFWSKINCSQMKLLYFVNWHSVGLQKLGMILESKITPNLRLKSC